MHRVRSTQNVGSTHTLSCRQCRCAPACAQAKEAKFCSQCGSALSAGSKVCSKCSKLLPGGYRVGDRVYCTQKVDETFPPSGNRLRYGLKGQVRGPSVPFKDDAVAVMFSGNTKPIGIRIISLSRSKPPPKVDSKPPPKVESERKESPAPSKATAWVCPDAKMSEHFATKCEKCLARRREEKEKEQARIPRGYLLSSQEVEDILRRDKAEKARKEKEKEREAEARRERRREEALKEAKLQLALAKSRENWLERQLKESKEKEKESERERERCEHAAHPTSLHRCEDTRPRHLCSQEGARDGED